MTTLGMLEIDGFHFMTATGWNPGSPDVTDYFDLDTACGIDDWINGFDGYRDVGGSTDPWGCT